MKSTRSSGSTPAAWTTDSQNSKRQCIRTQTGQNINVAVSGTAKFLRVMIEEDD